MILCCHSRFFLALVTMSFLKAFIGPRPLPFTDKQDLDMWLLKSPHAHDFSFSNTSHISSFLQELVYRIGNAAAQEEDRVSGHSHAFAFSSFSFPSLFSFLWFSIYYDIADMLLLLSSFSLLRSPLRQYRKHIYDELRTLTWALLPLLYMFDRLFSYITILFPLGRYATLAKYRSKLLFIYTYRSLLIATIYFYFIRHDVDFFYFRYRRFIYDYFWDDDKKLLSFYYFLQSPPQASPAFPASPSASTIWFSFR